MEYSPFEKGLRLTSPCHKDHRYQRIEDILLLRASFLEALGGKLGKKMDGTKMESKRKYFFQKEEKIN